MIQVDQCNGSGRNNWWVGSVYPSATNWCNVNNNGNPNNNNARNANGLAPSYCQRLFTGAVYGQIE